jgi:hypothetical protein
MTDVLAPADLSHAFLDLLAVVFVQRQIVVDGFVEDEAAVALLEGGEGIEGFDFVARGAEGDCLLLHAERIRCITIRDQSLLLGNSRFGRSSTGYQFQKLEASSSSDA